MRSWTTAKQSRRNRLLAWSDGLGLDRLDHAVLRALVGHADFDPDAPPQCHVRVDTLAVRTGYAPSSVRRGVGHLVGRGIIRVQATWKRRCGGQSANRYLLMVDGPDTPLPADWYPSRERHYAPPIPPAPAPQPADEPAPMPPTVGAMPPPVSAACTTPLAFGPVGSTTPGGRGTERDRVWAEVVAKVARLRPPSTPGWSEREVREAMAHAERTAAEHRRDPALVPWAMLAMAMDADTGFPKRLGCAYDGPWWRVRPPAARVGGVPRCRRCMGELPAADAVCATCRPAGDGGQSAAEAKALIAARIAGSSQHTGRTVRVAWATRPGGAPQRPTPRGSGDR